MFSSYYKFTILFGKINQPIRIAAAQLVASDILAAELSAHGQKRQISIVYFCVAQHWTSAIEINGKAYG